MFGHVCIRRHYHRLSAANIPWQSWFFKEIIFRSDWRLHLHASLSQCVLPLGMKRECVTSRFISSLVMIDDVYSLEGTWPSDAICFSMCQASQATGKHNKIEWQSRCVSRTCFVSGAKMVTLSTVASAVHWSAGFLVIHRQLAFSKRTQSKFTFPPRSILKWISQDRTEVCCTLHWLCIRIREVLVDHGIYWQLATYV